MIYRKYLGLDISAGELRVAVLRRKGKESILSGEGILPLPSGAVVPSLREPNIRDLEQFSSAAREVLFPLAGREDRIAVSLPDSSGRILLTRIEGSFRSRSEGLGVLKWQLRKSLPMDIQDYQIDFQVLDRKGGQSSVIVGMVYRPVLHQVEEVLSALGYNAVEVGFHSMNLYNFYSSKNDLGEDFLLIGVSGDTLSFQLFQNRRPVFYRCRRVDSVSETIFREVHRTLAAGQARFPESRRGAVFLHCDWSEQDGIREALSPLFDQEIRLLDPRLKISSSNLDFRQGLRLVSAVGGAERMMGRLK